jgi:recombination protein RecT
MAGTVKSGAIAKAQETKAVANAGQQTLKNLIAKMKPQIAAALPSVITPERFTRMALTALSKDPKLQECTPASFLGAMMQAAQLGVEPNTPLGQAYLIPFRNKGQMEAQFQLGYKGLIDLAYRSGEITSISAHEVCENDEFEYELGLEEKMKHKPALKDRGEVLLYYAVFRTKSGGCGFAVMSVEDVRKHMQKFSQAAKYGSSPWQSNFDEMAKKTVIKKVLKYAPIKTEFVRAMATDGTIKADITPDMVDAPDETVVTVDAEPIEETAAPQETPKEEPVVDPETGEILGQQETLL